MGPLTRIGAATQGLWRRLRRWFGSAAGRGACGRVALCGLLLTLSPQLVGLWRIALYGEAAEQGVLLCVAVVCWTVWTLVRDKRRRRHGKDADDGPDVADKAVQRGGQGVGGRGADRPVRRKRSKDRARRDA